MMVESIKIGSTTVVFDDDGGYVPRERRSSEEVKPRVERRMARIDKLTPEQRMVVHEHGWNLVETFLTHGVTSPRSMRALINAVKANVVDRMYLRSDE